MPKIPRTVSETEASGAQVIGGSLTFDAKRGGGTGTGFSYMTRTPGSSGDRQQWTFSCWYKLNHIGGADADEENLSIIGSDGNSSSDYFSFFIDDGVLRCNAYSTHLFKTDRLCRDFGGWYHFVLVLNVGTGNNLEIYVNGQKQTNFDTDNRGAMSGDYGLNRDGQHTIGALPNNRDRSYLGGNLSQVYMIDGYVGTPEDFGYTDPLTNTWRPKTYTGTFSGTNTFYLPLDGDSPIWEDQSGNGNDWIPINLGGGVSLDKATGGLPILNTVSGGWVGGPGVRSDTAPNNGGAGANNYVTMALPLCGYATDFSNSINSSATQLVVSATGAGSSDTGNFYGKSFYFSATDSDYLSIPDSTAFTLGSDDFTVEMWVNPDSATATDRWIGQINSGGSTSNMSFRMGRNSGIFIAGTGESSTDYTITGKQVPANKWTHCALVRDGNVLKAFQDGYLTGTTNFSGTVNDSSNQMAIGRLGESDGTYFGGHIQDVRLYKGFAKYTKSFTVPKTTPEITMTSPSGTALQGKLATTPSPMGSSYWENGGSDQIQVPYTDAAFDWTSSSTDFCVESWNYHSELVSGGSGVWGQGTSGGFQAKLDVIQHSGYPGYCWNFEMGGGQRIRSDKPVVLNKWTHVACVMRSGTGYLYVDGVQQGITLAHGISTANAFWIGRQVHDAGQYRWNGWISNFRVVTGSPVYSGNFVPSTKPLTNITNTKLLCLQDPLSLTVAEVKPGALVPGGNHLKPDYFSPFDTNIGKVLGPPYGAVTMNPLASDSYTTLKEGNLLCDSSRSGSHIVTSTVGVNSGKWYWEIEITNAGQWYPGLAPAPSGFGYYCGSSTKPTGIDQDSWGFNGNNAINHGSWNRSTFFYSGFDNSTFTGILGVAFDADQGYFWVHMDGTYGLVSSNRASNFEIANGVLTEAANYGQEVLDMDYTWFPAWSTGTSNAGSAGRFNFGQKPFAYPPPDGFEPYNKATTAISIPRSDQYVGVTTYNGTGSNDSAIHTGLDADLIWIKRRDSKSGGSSWVVQDTIRGGTNSIYFNSTSLQYTDTSDMRTFTSTGFTLGNGYQVNSSSTKYISYNFKAGGSKGTFNKDGVAYGSASAAGLTAGGITPTASSVGTKQGISIIKWTGSSSVADLPHGLSKAPGFGCIKALTGGSAQNWISFHWKTGKNYICTNLDMADNGDNNIFPNPADSTVIKFGDNVNTNDSGYTYIGYFWESIPGFSKFGMYDGNNSTTGPFVDLGFRPAIVLLKNTDNAANWVIYTDQQDLFNPMFRCLYLNDSAEENGTSTVNEIDFLSNGFTLRGDDTDVNDEDAYIYCAWAHQPLHNMYGCQANAR